MPGASPVVLLVEDEHDLRTTLEELLADEGFHVMAAADGMLAWEWVQAGGRPALVLLDFHMPRLNGWELIERLRALEATREVPLVAMSGSPVTHPALAATLRKPFELEAFLALVRRLAPPR